MPLFWVEGVRLMSGTAPYLFPTFRDCLYDAVAVGEAGGLGRGRPRGRGERGATIATTAILSTPLHDHLEQMEALAS
jgi:hypothetical protein